MSAAERDALQARFALRVAAQLEATTRELSPTVQARLDAARRKALAAVPHHEAALVSVPALAGATPIGRRGVKFGWGSFDAPFNRAASLVPLVMLVIGFVFVQYQSQQESVHAAAEVDAQLLSDELPPEAYTDPGFEAFLRSGSEP